ncbi:unnamed protein product [Cylicocyclus nassatus]|uniref:Protein zwilch n=1 Tax=Cylicocyclus nassatus TaxID=53992 RepID=A0AA36GG18_CYLNA|nr:unnamed protein product [Cylicocyclus nassatus]
MMELITNIHNQPLDFAKEDPESLLLSKYRVRKCKSIEVPILTDFYGNRQTDVVLIDLPGENVDKDKTVCAPEQHNIAESAMDYESAGPGGPLTFDFLSLSKLERCSDETDRFRGHQIVTSTSYFDCNPLQAQVAFGLRNRMLSKSFASVLEKKLDKLPIWIAANADMLGTTFVGFCATDGKISTFHTRCLGCFGTECESMLQSLCQRFGDGLETRSKAMALYKILGNKASSVWGPGMLLSDMTLTFKWEAKEKDYLLAPSPSAIAMFRFSPGWKDKRVALLENTEELEYLLLMASVLDSGAKMVWPTANEIAINEILEEVRELIAKYRVQNNETKNTAHGTRHVDFTELLWDILKKCPNFETLVAGLNIVFDALKQCRINAILHEDNKSTIARLIRDAQSRNLMLPRLEALTSIQILLEIGVERFRRDMVQAYITAGFMTNDSDLDLKPQPNATPEERARALLPLHLALQTMLEIQRHLTLPEHILTTMTRSVINKYCSTPIVDITKVHYETTVPLIHVKPDLLQKLPDLWTNETLYLHGNSVVATTLIHLTRDPRLRYLENRTSFIEEEEAIEDEADKRSAFLCTHTTSSHLSAEDLEEWH